MIKRENYLENMRPFFDEDLIKVITGVRRCGKSTLLEQIIEEIKQKTNEDHIIYINFEDIKYSNIESFRDLDKYIQERIIDKKKYYLFFDEI